jgi:ubiquinone/menaquinone biosynthesis C-methylase UbiE
MQAAARIGIDDVRQVYSSAEGDLWELIMGHQIHVGGLVSSLDLAERAGIGAGQRGVDLCCCSGAGMRCLVRFRNVASMTGVDATRTVVERGRARCRDEGLADRITLVLGDASRSGLPADSADFVWGEDAWCYVEDKPRLVAEAARLVRPGGVVAFTDWVEGPAGLSHDETERLLRFMKFPNVESLAGYPRLLERSGCQVLEASDTGRFAPYLELYQKMVGMQLTYDALRILAFDTKALESIGVEMAWMLELARAGKLAQGRFVARKPPAQIGAK